MKWRGSSDGNLKCTTWGSPNTSSEWRSLGTTVLAGTVTLSQKQYVCQIIEKHRMSDAKPVTTPMDPNVVLTKWSKAPKDNRASNLYAAAIGSLMYAAIGTRPDISFAVQTLSQFSQNPGPDHWVALKRVLRYLQGTQGLGLTYGGALS